ncbi:DnaJ-domain-containing protein [Amylocystis lapponica]|nr:DnaJ-domain-containing protein [Amylocystis lapponica]
MAARRSLYDILGVRQDAPPDAVRKAYKTKVLETHPDKLRPGAPESERQAAEARFRDIRAAFEVLSDPAKRLAYDNGLNYLRKHAHTGEQQAKLARERAEWARQAELRHQERMRVLREEIRASQKRYRETMAKVELRYQERMHAMEEQLKQDRETERRAETAPIPAALDLADDMLAEMRKMTPEWEVRKQEALRRKAERMRSEERTAAKG